MHGWLIPALPGACGSVSLAAGPVDALDGEEPDLKYTASLHGDTCDMRFGQAAAFRVCFTSRTITLVGGVQDDPAMIDHLLFDHVIPRTLAAEAPLVLHGSLVEIGGRLSVFVGETGAGKSTLGASLHAHGHRLLGDDAVIVTEADGAFLGEAVYPSLRLFPDSIAELLGERVDTAPMAAYSEKRHVTGFRTASAGVPPLPIACIFSLAGGEEAPRIRPLSPREGCMALVDQSFALDPEDVRAAGGRLAAAAQLASASACFELAVPHDYARLPEAHRLIEAAMAGCGTDTAPDNKEHAR